MEICQLCSKSYKNLFLHIVKGHKKFLCSLCNRWLSVEKAVTDIEDKNKGKITNRAQCLACFECGGNSSNVTDENGEFLEEIQTNST